MTDPAEVTGRQSIPIQKKTVLFVPTIYNKPYENKQANS
jgi:hypothetical protein